MDAARCDATRGESSDFAARSPRAIMRRALVDRRVFRRRSRTADRRALPPNAAILGGPQVFPEPDESIGTVRPQIPRNPITLERPTPGEQPLQTQLNSALVHELLFRTKGAGVALLAATLLMWLIIQPET